MTQNVKNAAPIDIGHSMARTLVVWRPEMAPADVTSAVMHALDRYSERLEGSSEDGLRQIIFALQDALTERVNRVMKKARPSGRMSVAAGA